MDSYILDAVRTPRGAGKETGSLYPIKPVEMAKQLLHALETRNGLDTAQVDDVIIGCTNQLKDQGANIARIAVLYANWKEQVSGATLNRFCSSGLDAIGYAALKVHAGMENLVVAGGVQSLSRIPMGADEGAWYADPEVMEAVDYIDNIVSADLMATLEGFTREELDEYGVRSHQRAATARDNGYFQPSLIPVHDQEGKVLLERDELIRDDSSMEKSANLKPFYQSITDERVKALLTRRYPHIKQLQHLHHRGNSPSLADGGSLLMVSSLKQAQKMDIKPKAKIISIANTSSEPTLMLGALKAAEKALSKVGLRVQDIDLFECNESFASTVLKFQHYFDIDEACLNVNGGAISMGHALGGTGGMLLSNLINELDRRKLQRGLATISGGAGIGTAMIIERYV